MDYNKTESKYDITDVIMPKFIYNVTVHDNSDNLIGSLGFYSNQKKAMDAAKNDCRTNNYRYTEGGPVQQPQKDGAKSTLPKRFKDKYFCYIILAWTSDGDVIWYRIHQNALH